MSLLVMTCSLTISAQDDDFHKDFEEFRKKAHKDYDDFRKQCLMDYSNFVREAWKEFGIEAAVPMPEEKEIEPMLAPGADQKTASWFSKLFGKRKNKVETPEKKEQPKVQPKPLPKKEHVEFAVKEVIKPEPVIPQPQPIAEVKEDDFRANGYYDFEVFGTKCRVRIGDNCRVPLKSLESNAVADAIQEFVNTQYDNLLYDCLQERKNHKFSDWAYYQMLKVLTDKYYGKDSNQGVLVRAFLYSQSGYKMRLAHDGNRLYLLAATRHFIYNKPFFSLEGISYFLLDNNETGSLRICQAAFPKESSLSLQISAVQDFGVKPVTERIITSQKDSEFSFSIVPNKNYIDFYETYPSSCVDNNFMTRWAMYANTPIEASIRSQLYPPMKEKLQGLSQEMAVQELLWWVQTGFEYQFDEEVWGVDRAFFGEETLFYPFCDCEDRSILLSHLVRELVGLDVILVYYPGHLAMAVNFTDDVEGDCINYNGRKFIVCDPTYIGARIGETMPMVQGLETTVILLQKS